MAKYFYNGGHNINLLNYSYELYDEGDNYFRLGINSKDNKYRISFDCLLKFDKDLEDENVPLFGPYLYYKVNSNGEAVLDYVGYDKGKDNEECKFELNKVEEVFFQNLLDKTTKEWF